MVSRLSIDMNRRSELSGQHTKEGAGTLFLVGAELFRWPQGWLVCVPLDGMIPVHQLQQVPIQRPRHASL